MNYCVCCKDIVDNVHSTTSHNSGPTWIEYKINIPEPDLDKVKNMVFIHSDNNRFDKKHNSNYYDSLYVEDIATFKGMKTWEEAKETFYKLKVFQ